MPTTYAAITMALADSGLVARGGAVAVPGEELPDGVEGRPAAAVVLVGNVGGAMWAAFSAARRAEPHPLDAWARRVLDPVAAALDARAVYPSDRPWLPFQRWAQRAEAVAPSPIGLLIHPEHGLWHAYRGALLLAAVPPDLPRRGEHPSPCATCADRPCLSACPVGAHSAAGFAVDACTRHLVSAEERCIAGGCRSRDACPVGRASRFPDAQVRFHMAAFREAREAPDRGA